MLSPAPSQQLLLSESASNETTIDAHCPPYDWTQKYLAKAETKAKINVSCINCYVEENRDWRGCIIGKGTIGSLSAFLTRIKNKNKMLNRNTLLITLLNICDNCCIESDWKVEPNQDHIMSDGSINKISASLVLSLSYKEVEIVASSRYIQ